MERKHEILIGTYRSGKSWQLLEKALEHCRNQKGLAEETLIIVPSQRYRALTEKRLQKLLLENKPDPSAIAGLWGLKILTFNQFCQSFLLKAGVFTKVLPKATRSVLIASLSKKLEEAGIIKKLAPVINFSGTQASILDLIDEWQSSGYQAAHVLKQVKAKATEGHHIELAEIYSLYEQVLQQNNYADEQGMMTSFIDLLAGNNNFDYLSKYIVVDGFDRWHILQLQLLNALSKQVPEISISFDYDQPGDNLLEEYAWKEKNYNQIKQILGDTFTFIKASAQPQLDKKKIEISPAGDRLAEAAIIAARVKAAIVLDGIKPSEIVVSARSLNLYKAAFEAAFHDSEIDYYIDETIELITLPVVRFLLDLFSLAENDFKRRQVIDCLRSPNFKLANFNLTKDDIEELNRRSLADRTKVVSGRDEWQSAVKDNLKLATNLNKIFDLVIIPKNIGSALQYVTWVEDLLEKVFDYNVISEYLVEAINKFRVCLADLIQQEEILRSCGLAIKKTKAQFYYQHLLELVKKANFRPSSPAAGKVLITSIDQLPNEKFKQIYIGGMLEGEFPSSRPDSGFLAPEELSQWQRFGVPIYDPRREAGYEYYLFASAINRAENKVIFSYPSADIISTKEEPVPSFFLTSLDMENDNNSRQPILFETFTKTANSARNAAAYYLWHKMSLSELFNTHHRLLEFRHKLEEKLSFAHKRLQQSWQSSLNGYLVDYVRAGTVQVRSPEYWSASQLNEYGKCPFRYWMGRTLQITPHVEPEAGLPVMERGSFYHKVLELYYREVIDSKLPINAENREQLSLIFERAIKDSIDWLEKESWFRPTEFWSQEKEELIFRLRNFFVVEYERFQKENGQFQPYMVEATFGPESQPLVMDKDGTTALFRGKIDRIDIEAGSGGGQKRLRLIDYKSGSGLPTGSDFESGRDIQLPLYALAAQQAVLPGSYAEACSYLSIRSGKASTQEGPVLRTYLGALPEKVFQFIENIKAGDFSRNPSNTKICETCDHQTVCRIKEFPKQFTTEEPNLNGENSIDD